MALKFEPLPGLRCLSTQAIKLQTEAAYKAQHAQLLAELSAVVGKPLHRVEKIAGRQGGP